MAVKICHASSDERGKYNQGIAGDQTGKEVCMRDWYNRPWNVIVRPLRKEVADKIVSSVKAACDNKNIGYDQYQRTTLYTQAEKVDFDLSKINVACECDCSSLVAVCVNAAGVKVNKDIYTGNMVKALQNTGEFEVLKDKKYLSSDKYLQAGDILVYEGHHTAIAVENGSEIKPSGKFGWLYEDNGWRYYLNNEFYPANDWCEVSDKNGNKRWAWFDGSGHAISNTWKEYKEKWYYFDADCYMVTSAWVNWKEKDYYLLADGTMCTNCYVMSTDKKTLYHIDSEGCWDHKDFVVMPSDDIVYIAK